MERNHRVPDFQICDDDPANIPSSSQAKPAAAAAKKSAVGEEDLTELLWQNGKIVLQSQNQRSQKRGIMIGDAVLPAEELAPAPRQIPLEEYPALNLFIQEEEMSNWLQYPLDDISTPNFERDLYADLLFPTRLAPISDVLNEEFKLRMEHGGPSTEPTVVDSSDTPALRPGPPKSGFEYNFDNNLMHISDKTLGAVVAPFGASDMGLYDFAILSPSHSGASASASVEPTTPKPVPPVMEDRKRKGREVEDASFQNEVVDVEYCDGKKRVQAPASTSTKRSRAAEVHNQSERRRRDRINVKMKALQDLIPRCNKSDKASMLDEAIEYLKSLQMQVQMMSMGCTMFPMMFPGVQHYMPNHMGMGGMGMDMGMIRPMMQFPPALPAGNSGTVPNQPGTNMGPPRFPPIPNFHLPSVDPNRIQSTPLPVLPVPVPDSVMNTFSQNLNQPGQMPQLQQQSIVDAYQQYLLLQQSRASLSQNPSLMNQPNPNNPGGNDHGNFQSG